MSVTMVIKRHISTVFGTGGHVTAYRDEEGSEILETGSIEKPWRENKVRVSCIPEGRYTVKRRDGSNTSLKYPNAWEVQDVPNRTAILFHAANKPTDLLGCIAFNETICQDFATGYVYGRSSMDAFRRFDRFMGDETEFTLMIIE